MRAIADAREGRQVGGGRGRTGGGRRTGVSAIGADARAFSWHRTTGLQEAGQNERSKWQLAPVLQGAPKISPLRWRRATVLQGRAGGWSQVCKGYGSEGRVCRKIRLQAFAKPSQAAICEAFSSTPFAKAELPAICKAISRESADVFRTSRDRERVYSCEKRRGTHLIPGQACWRRAS